jgi:hypothetical protein
MYPADGVHVAGFTGTVPNFAGENERLFKMLARFAELTQVVVIAPEVISE